MMPVSIPYLPKWPLSCPFSVVTLMLGQTLQWSGNVVVKPYVANVAAVLVQLLFFTLWTCLEGRGN